MWVPLAEHSCIVSFPNPPLTGNETSKVCSPMGDHRSVYHHIAVRQLKCSHVNEVEVKPQIEAARKVSAHDQMFYIQKV